jgi:hypothetical protein
MEANSVHTLAELEYAHGRDARPEAIRAAALVRVLHDIRAAVAAANGAFLAVDNPHIVPVVNAEHQTRCNLVIHRRPSSVNNGSRSVQYVTIYDDL